MNCLKNLLPRFAIGLIYLFAIPNSLAAQQTKQFESVRNYLNASAQKGIVAGGTVLVYHQGKECFSHSFGYEDLKTKRPFKKETPVVIASISKPLLGTAIHKLIELGKLEADVPIDMYLPEFSDLKLEDGTRLQRAPTVTELLTHMSGIRHDSAEGGRVWYQSWTRSQSLEYVVKRIAKEFPFKSVPGNKYAYSGIGTEVAARIAEVVSEKSRNRTLTDLLAIPLEMNNTFYRNRIDVEKRKVKMPGRYFRSKETGQLILSKKRPLVEHNQYNASGGSIVSTAPDLLKWLMMIRDKGMASNQHRFLAKSSIESILQPQKGSYNTRGGLFVRRKDKKGNAVSFGHTGSSGTNVWIDIEHDIIGIMLTQTRGSDIKPFRMEVESKINELLIPKTETPNRE